MSDLKQNVARTQSCGMRRTALVNVLEHPALFTVEVATHKCGGNGMASGNIRTFGMAQASVAGLQFAQQVLNLLFELFVSAALENLSLSSVGQLFPIRPVHTGIEMLPPHKFTDPRINHFFPLQVETHWPSSGIGDPPSPIRTKAPQ